MSRKQLDGENRLCGFTEGFSMTIQPRAKVGCEGEQPEIPVEERRIPRFQRVFNTPCLSMLTPKWNENVKSQACETIAWEVFCFLDTKCDERKMASRGSDAFTRLKNEEAIKASQ
uniref:Uncharacterized protein n=1 Tax=Sphaerodactylus townsendi TaxID=933632 RepID=A0ACB8FXA3_9SAUR